MVFDLTSGTVDRPFHDRHVVPTILSVAAHIVVVGAVVGAALFLLTEGLPEPPQVMLVFVTDVAPPPPPPPPPSPGPVSRPEPSEPESSPVPTVVEPRLVAPLATPSAIVAERSFGPGAGVTGGVPGGVPGGVVGGVVGGLVVDAPPPPAPAETDPVRVGGNIKTPALIRRVEPIYPKAAVAANLTGLVLLEAIVNEHGKVTDITVLRSRGVLDQAAIDAVSQWRYEPLLLNGIPRAFVLTVSLNFSVG